MLLFLAFAANFLCSFIFGCFTNYRDDYIRMSRSSGSLLKATSICIFLFLFFGNLV